MQVPAEFTSLTRCFYQGCSSDVSTPQEWAALPLRSLSKAQQIVVKQFFAGIAGEQSDRRRTSAPLV